MLEKERTRATVEVARRVTGSLGGRRAGQRERLPESARARAKAKAGARA